MPIPLKEHLILTELCRRPFQGDPGLVIDVVNDAPFEESSLDEVSSETFELLDGGKNSKSNVAEGMLADATDENQIVTDRVLPTTTVYVATEAEIEQQRLSQTEQDNNIESVSSLRYVFILWYIALILQHHTLIMQTKHHDFGF